MAFIAGIDIGGTRTRCALARRGKPHEIYRKTSVATPQQGPDAVLDIVEDIICDKLGAEEPICAVGCVAPGFTDTQSGVVIEAANLNNWMNVPLVAELERRLQAPVLVENDVNAAALAETRLSVSTEMSSVVYVTLSTGVAAGIVIDGKILRGANYCAGEIGNMIPSPQYLDQDWQPGGCLEQLAGGIGLAAQWATTQGIPSNTTSALEVFQAADAGDVKAAELINKATDYFAQAIVALVSVLDPEIVILGGSIGLARPEIAGRVRQTLARSVPHVPSVLPSCLGDDAPLLGSLILAEACSGDSSSGPTISSSSGS
ncbi:MAG: ROK family protein [Rhodothermaceae bacterium]|nr:ROK family protein [Rhodothermaceae bacterium]MYF39750.1 ROK family protein [Rhodothermaceae bacterium]